MGCRRCCLRGREAAGKALLRHTREGGSGFANTVRREHSTIPLVLELLAAGEHPVGCDHPRVHVDLQQGRGKRRDAVDLAVARQHAAGPLAPPRANGGEDGGGLALGRDLHDELRRVGDGVDLVVGREHSTVPLARLLTDVAEGLQGVRDWVDLKDRGGVVGLRELHTAHQGSCEASVLLQPVWDCVRVAWDARWHRSCRCEQGRPRPTCASRRTRSRRKYSRRASVGRIRGRSPPHLPRSASAVRALPR